MLGEGPRRRSPLLGVDSSTLSQRSPQYQEVFDVLAVVRQQCVEGAMISIRFVLPPELDGLEAIDVLQCSGYSEGAFDGLESAVQALLPTFAHEVAVFRETFDVDAQPALNEGIIEPAPVIGVRCLDAAKQVRQTISGEIPVIELDDRKPWPIRQPDPNDGDVVGEP